MENDKLLAVHKKLNAKLENRTKNPNMNYFTKVFSLINEVNSLKSKDNLDLVYLPNLQTRFMQFILPVELEKIRINERGNKIWGGNAYGDACLFDNILSQHGFQQFETNQDASYFGVWISAEHLCTVTFAEGYVTLCMCSDLEHYNTEIKDCIQFYEQN